MRKVAAIIVTFFMITSLYYLLDEEVTSVKGDIIPPRGVEDWTNDMDISEASEASFIGERADDFSGISVSGAGDVNGDGFDDILIGAPWNSDGGNSAGQTYLILGKSSGLAMDADLSNADASFIGEDADDHSGCSVSGAGDVNGDGYDDILIGANWNDDGGSETGQTYLILGKASGWVMDTDLSNADASFIGEDAYDYSGNSVSEAGDVNGDGYDDILIGAYNNWHGGGNAGQTYLIFGKASGWVMDIDLSNADASFIGEDAGDQSGSSVSGAGDVNGDGYDDILIGAYGDDDGGEDAGQTYLILGKSSGWAMDMDLSNADASFIGEDAGDWSGISVSGAGDVNYDGFDDIIIGAQLNDGGGNYAGQTYLILGKSSGWVMDMGLSNADPSFIGEDAGDRSGYSVSGAGDVNCDGFDDILIGAYGNRDGGGANTGQTYLILGKASGWVMDMDLSNADASFIGEDDYDYFGYSVSGAGDVNGDGYDDLLIGAYGDEDGGGTNAGQSYLVTGSVNTEPKEVYTFEAYREPYFNTGRVFDIGETIYLELTGLDGNSTCRDGAVINIDFQNHLIGLKRVGLLETGLNTGVYHGQFIVPSFELYFDVTNFEPRADPSFAIDILIDYPFRPISVSSVSIYADEGLTTTTDKLDYGETAYFAVTGDDANPLLQDKAFLNLSSDKNGSFTPPIACRETGNNTGLYVGSLTIPDSMVWFENITATSVRDPTKSDVFKVHTAVQIRPFEDNMTAYEDMGYCESYWNFGWVTNPTWTLTTDKDWLQFDQVAKELYGTPDNTEVGLTTVELNLTDTIGHFSSHKFRIFVFNSNPNLIGEDLLEVDQGEYYEADYDCDDDGQGEITYFVSSNADWLEMDSNTGVLFGLPENDDVGSVLVQVSVQDGNDGWDSRQFNITVHNVNDAPVIITDDIVTVNQDEHFIRNYQAEEIDVGDEVRWELHTDANFFSIDPNMGTLTGIPSYLDVGTYFVNVSVWDLSDAFDFHNFTLEVLNVNDVPIWVDFPENVDVIHGQTYLFYVNANDFDGDLLTYYISSTPDSDIVIDEYTGSINWTADIHIFEKAPFKLEVRVSAWDGFIYSNQTFTITVVPTEPPEVELLGPADGIRSSSTGTTLMWEGTDPEDEPITYDIYLHQTEAFVQGYREEALHEEGYEGMNITLTGLTPGERFFWTVIPSDGVSLGICTSGVQSFRVNYKPTFKSLEKHEVPVGTDFKYKISCTDEDSEDLPNLKYSLVDAPEGMTISIETGMIRWTPSDDQVMLHTVTVQVTDGIETNTATFEIEVVEGESSTSTLLITIAIVVIVVLLLALGIFFFIKQKKKVEEEALRQGEEERAALEKDKEEDTPSYEDLYGVPAPQVDEEGMTTRELKDYVHDQIEELEDSE